MLVLVRFVQVPSYLILSEKQSAFYGEAFIPLLREISLQLDIYQCSECHCDQCAGTLRLLHQLKSRATTELYHDYRQLIGRSILLGLEFLIAGDVIRTVIVSHTMTDVAALALMVLMRTFLSFTLTLEIEGKLPWIKRGQSETERS